MLAVRQQREPAHLAYLEAHKHKILIAGGLRPAPGETFVGGLWVLEVASRDEALALIENDPYYQPEHRKYRVLGAKPSTGRSRCKLAPLRQSK